MATARTLHLLACLLVASAASCDGDRPTGPRGGGAAPVDPPAGADAGRRCHTDGECDGGACVRGVCAVAGQLDAAAPADAGDAGLDAAARDAARDAAGADAARDAAPEDSGPPGVDTRPGDDVPAPADVGPRRCRIPSDCAPDQTCIEGLCGPECREDRDCPGPEEVCRIHRCQAPGARCAAQDDCLPGEVCSLGTCRPEPDCVFREDCPGGQDCVNGRCQPPGEGEGEGEGGGEGEGEGGCPPRAGAYREDCRCRAQCASEMCLDTPPQGGDGVCTQACGGDADCPGLDACSPVGGALVCAPNDAGEECGDPTDCTFGLCVNDPAAQRAVCSLPCEDTSRCPQAMGCGIVMAQGGQRLWACVPVGGRCGAGAGCTTGRCLPDRVGAGAGYCTNDCLDDRYCTLGSTCCPVPDPNDRSCPVGVCVRGGCPAPCARDLDCGPGFYCAEVENPNGGWMWTCVGNQCR